jgi:group I intron endonuclease
MELLQLPRKALHIFDYFNLHISKLKFVNHRTGSYGIYNTITNKIYIGSTVDLSRRFGNHLKSSTLKKKKATSDSLIADIIKFGPDKFQFIVFDVIESVSNNRPKHLVDQELLYLERNLLQHLFPLGLTYNKIPFPSPRVGYADNSQLIKNPIVLTKEMSDIKDRLAELKSEERKLKSELKVLERDANKIKPTSNKPQLPFNLNEMKTVRSDLRIASFGRPIALINLKTNERHEFLCKNDASVFLSCDKGSLSPYRLESRNNIIKGWKVIYLPKPSK